MILFALLIGTCLALGSGIAPSKAAAVPDDDTMVVSGHLSGEGQSYGIISLGLDIPIYYEACPLCGRRTLEIYTEEDYRAYCELTERLRPRRGATP